MADGAIAALDLSDDEYTVVQSLVRNRYKAYDADDDVVLRGKQKMFELKEEFPFVNADGDDAFTVEASGVLDFAGDYALVDSRTDETVVVLDCHLTLVSDVWTLRDPDTGDEIAQIRSKSKIVSLLRHVHGLLSLVPHEYEITTPDGRHVGTIDGRFSLKDTYDVTIDDASGVPKEAVVAATMVIDAIEGN